jgi:hypothetical protein
MNAKRMLVEALEESEPEVSAREWRGLFLAAVGLCVVLLAVLGAVIETADAAGALGR